MKNLHLLLFGNIQNLQARIYIGSQIWTQLEAKAISHTLFYNYIYEFPSPPQSNRFFFYNLIRNTTHTNRTNIGQSPSFIRDDTQYLTLDLDLVTQFTTQQAKRSLKTGPQKVLNLKLCQDSSIDYQRVTSRKSAQNRPRTTFCCRIFKRKFDNDFDIISNFTLPIMRRRSIFRFIPSRFALLVAPLMGCWPLVCHSLPLVCYSGLMPTQTTIGTQ